MDLIDLGVSSSSDVFIGPRSPERSGRTYGGQLMAQAMAAAERTITDAGSGDERQVNSLRGLFLSAGQVDLETRWEVERIRDGRSFATRSVSGYQGDRELFRALISFHTFEDGLRFQPELDFDIAALPNPEEVATSYLDFCQQHPDIESAGWSGGDQPMDILYIDPPEPAGGAPDARPQRMWIRVTERLSDNPAVHRAALAYLSDSTLIDHALLPHGLRWHDARLTATSLDHAMWFRSPERVDDWSRVDEWLLYDQRVDSTGNARGLATGRFYDRSGELLATCSQEGLMRYA